MSKNDSVKNYNDFFNLLQPSTLLKFQTDVK